MKKLIIIIIGFITAVAVFTGIFFVILTNSSTNKNKLPPQRIPEQTRTQPPAAATGETTPQAAAPTLADNKTPNFLPIETLQIMPGSKWEIDGNGNIIIYGSVKNTGNVPIAYFLLTAKYLDNKGRLLRNEYTNDIMKLHPGDQRQFEIIRKYNESYRTIQLNVITVISE